MASPIVDTIFTSGTTITSNWLNGVNDAINDATQDITGATPRTVVSKLADTVSVKDFGAVGDGVTDDTAAIQAAIDAVNAAGNGVLIFPAGNYKIWPTLPATPLATFSSCSGLSIQSYGATLTVGYSWTGSEQQIVFQFTDCSDVSLQLPKLVSTVQSVSQRHTRGPTFVKLFGKCENFNVPEIAATGALTVFQVYALSSATEAERSRNIVIGVGYSDRCGYGVSCQFSGDDLFVGSWYSIAPHRTYFVYGVKNHTVNIESKDQDAGDVRIETYEGATTQNITVNYTNTASTAAQPAAEACTITFGDQTPGTISDVSVNLTLKWPASGYFGRGFAIEKYNNAGSPDTVARGHTLQNVKVSGSFISSYASAVPMTTIGTWSTGDYWKNICFSDILISGTGSGTVNLGSSVDPAVFSNIDSSAAFYVQFAPATAPAKLYNCKAVNFTSGTSDTGYADYFSCEVTDGTLQSSTNKTFFDFVYAGRAISDYSKSQGAKIEAGKSLSGDLTGTNNIFFVKLPAGIGAYFRLTYSLVADSSDTNPATRDETYGVKSFSATMSSGGVWAAQTAVANEVTERTQGTASAVSVSLVNGTSSGAYIAVACTNYNSANARASFVLECIPMNSGNRFTLSVVPA